MEKCAFWNEKFEILILEDWTASFWNEIRCRGELEEVLEREGFESAKAFLANFKRGL